MPSKTYPSPDLAAKDSRMGMAISPAYNQPTPRGVLPCVLIVHPKRSAWWAYASAPGIRVPETYAKADRAAIDKVREWKAY